MTIAIEPPGCGVRLGVRAIAQGYPQMRYYVLDGAANAELAVGEAEQGHEDRASEQRASLRDLQQARLGPDRRACGRDRCSRRKVLTRQGEPGRECFVIADGASDRIPCAEGGTASLGPGDVVGEMSLLDQGPRSATVTARTDMHLFVLTSRNFSSLINRFPLWHDGSWRAWREDCVTRNLAARSTERASSRGASVACNRDRRWPTRGRGRRLDHRERGIPARTRRSVFRLEARCWRRSRRRADVAHALRDEEEALEAAGLRE